MNYLLAILLIITSIHGNTVVVTARATAQVDGSLVIRLVLPAGTHVVSSEIEGGSCGFGACATTATAGETRTMTATIEMDAPGEIGAIVTDPERRFATATTHLHRFYLP